MDSRTRSFVCEQIRSPAKIRSSQAFKRVLDGNDAGTSGLNKNAQRAGYREALLAGHTHTNPLVDEQQIGLDLSGKLNRLPLSAMKTCSFVRRMGCLDFLNLNLNSGWELAGPLANVPRCSFLPQLSGNSARNPHVREEPQQ